MSINTLSTSILQTPEYKAPTINKKTSNDKLMTVSKEFESLFLAQVFKEMNKSTVSKPEKGLFYGGMGEDIFKDMLFDKYSSDISQQNSIGLAKTIYESLSNRKASV